MINLFKKNKVVKKRNIDNLVKLSGNSVSHKNDEYYTPKWLVDKIRDEFSVTLNYDPATTLKNSERLEIKYFDTIKTNGLIADWNDLRYKDIFVNPPFTLKKDFINKAVETILNGKKDRIFILLPNAVLTNKFMSVLHSVEWSLIIPSGRVQFLDSNYVQTKQSYFGSIVLVLNDSHGIYHWK